MSSPTGKRIIIIKHREDHGKTKVNLSSSLEAYSFETRLTHINIHLQTSEESEMQQKCYKTHLGQNKEHEKMARDIELRKLVLIST